MPDYRAAARRAATKAGIDPGVFARQIQQESGFNPNARSPAGAVGIAQIMPGTAAGWHVDPTNPVAALNVAAAHMADYVRKYGSMRNALIAYNAGPGAVGRGSLPAETRNYIATILGGSESGQTSVSPSRDSGGGAPAGGGTTVTTRTPGTDNRAARAQLVLSFLDSKSNDPVDFATQMRGLRDTPATSTTRTVGGGGGGGGGGTQSSQDVPKVSGIHGPLPFEGHSVAAWIAPILKFAREQGWKGGVNSGYRSTAEQTRIYNSGVRPAARPGTSNHEFTAFPGGAIDVSDAAQLSAILKRSKYANLLVWAGAKDPVHFSHPHGGSY